MFTGVIKLAQIDDYINPSQNCIQPKIMKPSKTQAQKATVTLNDCLACSGCITSAESILVEQMSVQKLLSKYQYKNQNEKIYFCISPQTLLALSKNYEISPKFLIFSLNKLFSKYFPSVKGLINLQNGVKICHELIYQQFQNSHNKQQINTILCSQCPGWVCYAQKTLNSQITQLMSHIKSPQQIIGNLIKNDILKRQGIQSLKSVYVVGVMPCYDKKLQAIRFNFQQQFKEVDLTITTGQMKTLIQEILKKNSIDWQEFLKQISSQNIQKLFEGQKSFVLKSLLYDQINIYFLKDQTSNGYIQYLLQKLNVKFQTKQVRNSDFIQYTYTKNQKQYKMAKCYGFRNIQKIVQLIKKKKCPYLYVEVMACPGGCFGGGGQIKYQDQKPKDTIQQLNKILEKHNQSFNNQIDNQKQLNMIKQCLKSLKRENITIKYKPIEKTLQANVSDW